MQFEWYRVSGFANEHNANSALHHLKNHHQTQHLTMTLRHDADAFGLYVTSPDATPLIHNVLSNSDLFLSDSPAEPSLTEHIDHTSNVSENSNSNVKSNSDTKSNGNAKSNTSNANHHNGPTQQQQDHAAFMYYQQFFLRQPQRVPLTVLFMTLGVIGVFIPMLFWESRFFYQLLWLSSDVAIGQQKYWQLITPTFIHFGWLHIIFNALWMGILGARVEYSLGLVKTIGVFIFISVVANLVQYVLSAGVPFGGLSGLVYGLMGFLIVQHKCEPTPMNTLGKGMVIMMLVFMLLGLFGIMDVFIAGSIANGAHLGGFIAGLIAAGLLYRKNLNQVLKK